MNCEKCGWEPFPGCLVRCGDVKIGPFFCPNCGEKLKDFWNELDSSREALLRASQLAVPHALPETFVENCNRIWEAFNLGKDYQRQFGDQEEEEETHRAKMLRETYEDQIRRGEKCCPEAEDAKFERARRGYIRELLDQIIDLKKEINVLDRLLEAIPECPTHGQCVPHALEWIAEMKELAMTTAKELRQEVRDAQEDKDMLSTGALACMCINIQKIAARLEWRGNETIL